MIVPIREKKVTHTHEIASAREYGKRLAFHIAWAAAVLSIQRRRLYDKYRYNTLFEKRKRMTSPVSFLKRITASNENV